MKVADEDGEYGDDLEQSTPDIKVVGFEMFVCSKVRTTDGWDELSRSTRGSTQTHDRDEQIREGTVLYPFESLPLVESLTWICLPKHPDTVSRLSQSPPPKAEINSPGGLRQWYHLFCCLHFNIFIDPLSLLIVYKGLDPRCDFSFLVCWSVKWGSYCCDISFCTSIRATGWSN